MLFYVRDTIIPVVHPLLWYQGWNKIDAGLMIDFCTRLLGVVQLRQLRVKPNTCTVPHQMSYLNLSCVSDYSDDIHGDFQETINQTNEETIKLMKYVWYIKDDNETGSTNYIGKLISILYIYLIVIKL